MSKRKKIILATSITAAITFALGTYYFVLKPANIRNACIEMAKTESGNMTGAGAGDYGNRFYNYYQHCLSVKGL